MNSAQMLNWIEQQLVIITLINFKHDDNTSLLHETEYLKESNNSSVLVVFLLVYQLYSIYNLMFIMPFVNTV